MEGRRHGPAQGIAHHDLEAVAAIHFSNTPHLPTKFIAKQNLRLTLT
jgi:hypothetical protein